MILIIIHLGSSFFVHYNADNPSMDLNTSSVDDQAPYYAQLYQLQHFSEDFDYIVNIIAMIKSGLMSETLNINKKLNQE